MWAGSGRRDIVDTNQVESVSGDLFSDDLRRQQEIERN